MDTMKIEDAPRVDNVDGGEIIPVAKGGTPKSVTLEQVKDFIVKAVKDVADGEFDPESDKLSIVQQDGETKRIVACGATEVAKALLAKLSGESTIEDPDAITGDEMLVLMDGNTNKSISLGVFMTAIESVVTPAADAYTITNLSAAESIGDDRTTYLPIGFVDRYEKKFRISFRGLMGSVRRWLIKDADERTTIQDTDTHKWHVLLQQGTYDFAYKVSLAALGLWDFIKKPFVPEGSSVENKIVTFGSADGTTIKGELTKVDTITDEQSTTDIPSAPAVKTYVDKVKDEGGDVKGPDSAATNSDTLAAFDGATGKKIKSSGKKVATSIGESPSDNNLPTEKAVADFVTTKTTGMATLPSEPTTGNVATFGADGKLVSEYGISSGIPDENPSEKKLVTEKAIEDRIAEDIAKVGRQGSWEEEIPVLMKGENVLLGSGVRIKKSDTTPPTSPTTGNDTMVPTTKWVSDELDVRVKTSTKSATDKKLVVGGENDTHQTSTSKVVETIDFTTSDNDIPNVKAVKSAINDATADRLYSLPVVYSEDSLRAQEKKIGKMFFAQIIEDGRVVSESLRICNGISWLRFDAING